jgi:RNA polymerase sigma-70 factor (ECF subfamily)
VVFSDLAPTDDEAAVEPERFVGADDPVWAGHWAEDPRRWELSPEDQVAQRQVLARVGQAIEALPEVQRAVITLHDVEGVGAKEICNILGLSETNQRVLLHRARAKVRRALESWFDQEADNV